MEASNQEGNMEVQGYNTQMTSFDKDGLGAAGFREHDTSMSPTSDDWKNTVVELMNMFGERYDGNIAVDANVDKLVTSFSKECQLENMEFLRENQDITVEGNTESVEGSGWYGESMREELVLDSFVLISDSWNVLSSNYSVTKGLKLDTGEHGLFMKEVSEEDNIGVIKLHGINGVEVFLEPSNNILTLLVVPIHGTWGRYNHPLDAKLQIEEAYVKAFAEAVEDLSSFTCHYWHFYNNHLVLHPEISLFPIHDEELAIFGPSFLNKMNIELQKLDLTVSLKVTEPSQSSFDWRLKPCDERSRTVSPFRSYNLNSACEIILKMKRVYKPLGFSLMWNGEGILEANSPSSSDGKNSNVSNTNKYAGKLFETYPLMLHGHGCYKIEKYKECGYYDEAQGSNAPTCALIEFNANPFDRWRLREEWKQPHIESALIGFPFPTREALKKKRWCWTGRLLDRFPGGFRNNEARFCTVIRCSVSGIMKISGNDSIIESILQYIFGKMYSPDEIRQYLSIVPVSSISPLVDSTLRVALNTIEHLVDKAMQNPVHDHDSLALGLVCEAILCFITNGHHFQHNEDWFKWLGLIPAAFRTCTGDMIFNGLDCMQHVQVIDGIIRYVGPHSILKQVSEFGGCVPAKCTHILEAYFAIPQEKSCPLMKLDKFFYCLAESLWNHVSSYATTEVSARAPSPSCEPKYLETIVWALRNEVLTPCTSYEFVDQLFAEADWIQPRSLSMVLKGLKRRYEEEQGRRDVFESLKYTIASYFDVKIFQSTSLAVVFPWQLDHTESRLSLLLPFAGNESDNFYYLEGKKARWILKHYQSFAFMPKVQCTHAMAPFEFNLKHRRMQGFPRTVKFFVQQLRNTNNGRI